MDSVRSPLAYPPVAKETISSERAAYVHISMIAPKAKHGAILFTLISQRVGHNTGDASDGGLKGSSKHWRREYTPESSNGASRAVGYSISWPQRPAELG